MTSVKRSTWAATIVQRLNKEQNTSRICHDCLITAEQVIQHRKLKISPVSFKGLNSSVSSISKILSQHYLDEKYRELSTVNIPFSNFCLSVSTAIFQNAIKANCLDLSNLVQVHSRYPLTFRSLFFKVFDRSSSKFLVAFLTLS